MYTIKSDDYSNHGLPIGATVERLPDSELTDWQRYYGGDWYTQGGAGDEVAIDPRDLS